MPLQYTTNTDGTIGHLKVTLPLTQADATQLKTWFTVPNEEGVIAPFHDQASNQLMFNIVSPVSSGGDFPSSFDFSPLIDGSYTYNGVTHHVDISGYSVSYEDTTAISGSILWHRNLDLTSYYTLDGGIYRNCKPYNFLISSPVPVGVYFDFTTTGKDMGYPDPFLIKLLDFYSNHFQMMDSDSKRAIGEWCKSMKPRADYLSESSYYAPSTGIGNVLMSYNMWLQNPTEVVQPGTGNTDYQDILNRLDALEKAKPPVVDLTGINNAIKALSDIQTKLVEQVGTIQSDVDTIKQNWSVVSDHERLIHDLEVDMKTVKAKLNI